MVNANVLGTSQTIPRSTDDSRAIMLAVRSDRDPEPQTHEDDNERAQQRTHGNTSIQRQHDNQDEAAGLFGAG
jgi:hypothetical protein